MEQVGNWGKWGKSDERGTLNHITAEAVRKALALVKRGKSYGLGIPIEKEAPVFPTRHKSWHLTTYANTQGPGFGHSDDVIFMHTHGTTHVDSLAHVWADGKLYNGYSAEDCITGEGAHRNGIDKMGPVVTRGIMIDIPRHRDVAYLEAGEEIGPDEIESCAKAHGVSFRKGDALLIRTGWHAAWKKEPSSYSGAEAGPGLATAKWFKEKELSVIGADNIALEAFPSKERFLPVHQEIIRNQGGYLIELLDLDEIAQDGVYEFLLVLAPLRITGGVGSPLNPVAMV